MTPEDLWHLCRLTWITKDPKSGSVSDAYRESTKYPALSGLLGVPEDGTRIEAALMKKCLVGHAEAAELVSGETGIVNFYGAYRNESRVWIRKNWRAIRRIIKSLETASGERAAENVRAAVDELPAITIRNSGADLPPSNILSPLLACLDKRSSFPILNGRVKEFLASVGYGSASAAAQHATLVRLQALLGYDDAYQLDAAVDRHNESFKKKCRQLLGRPRYGRNLALKDASDITSLMRHRRKRMKRLHNAMTNRLTTLLGSDCTEGDSRDRMWDVLVRPIRNKGRHLLIEAKSIADMPSARMAVGQLLDYRRFLNARGKIDLAVLYPGKPTPAVLAYLKDVQVRCLWFTGGNLRRVKEGRAVLWE